MTTASLVEQLDAVPGGGPDGVCWRAAGEINLLRSFIRDAMDHGVNGNRHYHAMKAGDLGDKIARYLEDVS